MNFGVSKDSLTQTIAAAMHPRFSLDSPTPFEAARQQMAMISSGVQDGFDDLSTSLRTAGMYIGLGGDLVACV